MLLNQKRAVSNIVLMIGVVLAMAVLLIGGAMVVVKLIDGQARASPEFIATDLVAIINTVQAAPETVTYNYYTEQDNEGFPRIGSLEIDDNAREVCVHSKTEGEIVNSIMYSAARAAGFGGVAYAYGKDRSIIARNSAVKEIRNQDQFEPLLKNLNKKTRYALGSDNKDGRLLRKYTSGAKLSKQETASVNKLLEKRSYLKELTAQREAIQRGENAELKAILKATKKPASWKSRILAKIPLTKTWKNSKLAARFMGYAQKTGQARLIVRIGGVLKPILKSPLKVGAISTKYTLVGGFLAFQYIMSDGDIEGTFYTAIQLSIYNLAPRVMGYITVKLRPWFVKTFAARLASNDVLQNIKAYLSKLIGGGTAACLGTHAGEAVINGMYAVWDMALFDTWFIQIYDASADAVKLELRSKSCKSFSSIKKPLLSPPNCSPKAKLKPPLDNDLYRGGIAAGYFTAAAAFTAGVPFAIAGATCNPASTEAAKFYSKVTMAAGAGAAAASTTAVVEALYSNPTAIFPESSCDSCDTQYLRQDCPNWYITQPDTPIPLSNFGISTPLLTSISGAATFGPLLSGGPVCAVFSVAGWASMACNGARYSLAMGTFFLAPDMVFSFLLQGDKIGFLKPNIRTKSADDAELPPSLKPLASDFADNDGYWYAELPYVIEITKIYTNDGNIKDRSGNLVIRKA